MAQQETEGIILRKYCLRETSYILAVFTKAFGKIRGVIKGVRGSSATAGGNLEIFTRCRVLFYRKKKSSLDLITQCEAMEPFLSVRNDIERVTYASYFLELIDAMTDEHDPNEKLYNVLLESLRLMGTFSSAKRIARIFELKMLDALGLSPRLSSCTGCDGEVKEEAKFSVENGGMLCVQCSSRLKTGMRLLPGTMNFMRRIQISELAKTAGIKVTREVGRETEEVLGKFLKYHVPRTFRSLKFLEQLEKTGVV
ncbi:MAG: DNA repair protein RecO [Candidatus Omnitrophota bacterium]